MSPFSFFMFLFYLVSAEVTVFRPTPRPSVAPTVSPTTVVPNKQFKKFINNCTCLCEC